MRTVILLIMAAIPALATYPNGYSYRRTITVQAAQVPSTQSNFPMLISGTYSYLATVANGGKVQGTCNQTTIVISVGCDIIFTSDAAGSTILNFEFETYSATTGAVNAWVKVPSISNGTVIYLFYGKSGVASFQGSVTGTWDSSFKLVWHLRDGTTLGASDSTSSANNGTITSATAQTGQVDGASGVTTTSTKIVSGSNLPVSGAGARTFSAWVKWNSVSGFLDLLGWGSQSNNSSFRISVDDAPRSNKICVWLFGAGGTDLDWTSAPVAGTWYYIFTTYDGTTAKISVNGGAFQTQVRALTTTASQLQVGSTLGSASASVDEVRVSDTARSIDWAVSEYNNQSAPSSFYAVGSETLAGNGSALIVAKGGSNANDYSNQRRFIAFLHTPFGTRKRSLAYCL